MIALKKITSLAMVVACSTSLMAQDLIFGPPEQEKPDFGFIISNAHHSDFGFEYRKPLNDKYRFKMGATIGNNYSDFGRADDLVFTSDSIAVFRNIYRKQFYSTVRAGVERKLRGTAFSFGAEVFVRYNRSSDQRQNYAQVLSEDGTWQRAVFETPGADGIDNAAIINGNLMLEGSSEYGQIIRHYVIPGLRLGINADVPLGPRFFVHFGIAGEFGFPTYMGATEVHDPLNEFLGTPPSIFDFDTNGNIGIRYILGSKPH